MGRTKPRRLKRDEIVRLTLRAIWGAPWLALLYSFGLLMGSIVLGSVLPGDVDFASWVGQWLVLPTRNWPAPEGAAIFLYLGAGMIIRGGLVGLLITRPIRALIEASHGEATDHPWRNVAWVIGVVAFLNPLGMGTYALPGSLNLDVLQLLPAMLTVANSADALRFGAGVTGARPRGVHWPWQINRRTSQSEG